MKSTIGVRLQQTALVWLVSVGMASSQVPDSTLDRFDRQLERAQEQFDKGSQQAMTDLLKSYDAYARLVKTSKQSPEARSKQTLLIQERRQALVENSVLPEEEEMSQPVLDYLQALHKAREGVRKVFNDMFALANKKDDNELLKKLVTAKAELDRQLKGRSEFKLASRWEGARVNPTSGEKVTIRLSIDEVDDNTFSATLDENLQAVEGTRLEASGELDGIAISWRTELPPVGGKPRSMQYEAFLAGSRIIGVFRGVNARGRPISGTVRMTLAANAQ